MVSVSYCYNKMLYTEASRKYGTATITSTCATVDDTDIQCYNDYNKEYEETKLDVERQINYENMKESLQIPSFKIIKNLHRVKKIRNFVINRQMNFNIRNAL